MSFILSAFFLGSKKSAVFILYEYQCYAIVLCKNAMIMKMQSKPQV